MVKANCNTNRHDSYFNAKYSQHAEKKMSNKAAVNIGFSLGDPCKFLVVPCNIASYLRLCFLCIFWYSLFCGFGVSKLEALSLQAVMEPLENSLMGEKNGLFKIMRNFIFCVNISILWGSLEGLKHTFNFKMREVSIGRRTQSDRCNEIKIVVHVSITQKYFLLERHVPEAACIVFWQSSIGLLSRSAANHNLSNSTHRGNFLETLTAGLKTVSDQRNKL